MVQGRSRHVRTCQTFASDSATRTPGEQEKDKGVEQKVSKALRFCGSEQADAEQWGVAPTA